MGRKFQVIFWCRKIASYVSEMIVTAAPVLQKDIYGPVLSMVVRASISGEQSANRANSLRLKK